MDMNMGSNPFKRLMGSMMDGMMGPWFEQGLNALDSAAAANPIAAPAPAMPDSVPADTALVR
jgi:hypothetical protein